VEKASKMEVLICLADVLICLAVLQWSLSTATSRTRTTNSRLTKEQLSTSSRRMMMAGGKVLWTVTLDSFPATTSNLVYKEEDRKSCETVFVLENLNCTDILNIMNDHARRKCKEAVAIMLNHMYKNCLLLKQFFNTKVC